MINLLIQILTLISGLVVNFVIPGLYGLEAYGIFIKANILVFLFQKLLDIINEQLIANIEAKYIFVTSIFMGVLVFSLFSIFTLIDNIGNPLLLAAMLLSSACLLSLFSLRLHQWIVGYLILFLCVFFSSLFISYKNIFRLTIVDTLILTNVIPCLFAIIVLITQGAKLPVGKNLLLTFRHVIVSLPKMISITLTFNLFTSIFPYFLSKTLPAQELGLFRVTVSIIQSATSLFPVNVRAIFVSFVSGEKRQERYKVIMSITLFYFALVGAFGYSMAWFFEQYSPYLVMLPCLPVLYWTVVTERYLVASGSSRKVIMTNLVIAPFAVLGIIMFVLDLRDAEVFYALGFSAYLMFLHIFCRPGIHLSIIFWVAIMSPLSILIKSMGWAWDVFYMVSLLIIAVAGLGLRAKSIHTLRF
ncbi:hypothetical protein ACW9H6_24760 [Pseudomonas sp. SDO528_S397]